MKLPRRAIHLDFHTLPAVPDVGIDFNGADFARTLADARVDFITVFAKCNLGLAYYPTKVGVVHPSLTRDLLGEMVDACHARDIAVAAYFNSGLDHEMALRHRDWALLGDDGRTYGEDHLDHFFRTMCFTSPWADHLAAMIDEVLSSYPIDGLFLDCWYFGAGCQGYECAAAMLARNMDPTDPLSRVAFQDEAKLSFIRRVRLLIDEKRPEATYFLNGIPYDLQLPFASHLDVESLPTGGWGYDNFPWKVRYLRKRVRRVVGQTGRFHRSWGDFGGLRTQAGLDYDCFQATSHAAAVCIGDHMHPRGVLSGEAYRRIASIYRRLEALDEWTRDASPLTDTAVLASFREPVGVSLTEDHRQVVGATRALAELKAQFDVLTPDDDFSGYRTLVLLDGARLGPKASQRIRKHLAAGGAVLSTGTGGMLADPPSAGWLEEWGIQYVGPEPCDPPFLLRRASFASELPREPLTLLPGGVAVRCYSAKQRFAAKHEPSKGTKTLADVVGPYFNRHWDGFHGHVYTPPDRPARRPAITMRGRVIHFASPVFTDYAVNANPLHRALVANALGLLNPDALVFSADLPSFARLTLTTQGARTIVHLLSYVPELRTRPFTQAAVPGTVAPSLGKHAEQILEMIEEPITLRNVRVSLKRGAARCVYLAPSREPINFSCTGGRVLFTVPEVVGYQMIVVE